MTFRTVSVGLALVLISAGGVYAESRESSLPVLITADAPTPHPLGWIRDLGSSRFLNYGLNGDSFSLDQSLVFSPDQKTVYVVGGNGLVALDSTTGDLRFRYPNTHWEVRAETLGDQGLLVKFTESPFREEHRVLLDYRSGRELERKTLAVEPQHQAIAPPGVGNLKGGRTVAVISRVKEPIREKVVREPFLVIQELRTRRVQAELGRISGHFIVSPDQSLVGFANPDGHLIIAETVAGKQLASVSLGTKSADTHTEAWGRWSPDSKLIYCWRQSGKFTELVAIDAQSGEARPLTRSDERPLGAGPVLSPDGLLLAHRAAGSSWVIIQSKDGAEKNRIDVQPGMTAGEFAPDSRSFWIKGMRGISRFDLNTSDWAPLVIDSFSPIESMAFSNDGAKLYAISGAKRFTWDSATGREELPRQVQKPFLDRQYARCVHISPDGRRTLWIDQSSSLRSSVLSAESGDILRIHSSSLINRATQGREYDFSADYQSLLFEDEQRTACAMNPWRDGANRKLSGYKDLNYPLSRAISPDGSVAAILHYVPPHDDGTFAPIPDRPQRSLEFWNVSAAKLINSVSPEGLLPVTNPESLEISGDGQVLRIRDFERIAFYKIPAGELLRLMRCPAFTGHVATHPNRYWELAQSRSDSNRLSLVEVDTQLVARTWVLPGDRCTAWAFTRDGRTFAIACDGAPVSLVNFYEPRPASLANAQTDGSDLLRLLSSRSAVDAFDAMCELIHRGEEALPLLKRVAKQTRFTEKPAVNEILAELDSHLTAEGMNRAEITKWNEGLRSQKLAERLETNERLGQEVRRRHRELRPRIERILTLLAQLPSVEASLEELVANRVVAIAVAIDVPASRTWLAELAKLPDNSAITRASRAAMLRDNP